MKKGKSDKRRRSRGGFTLVELLLVVAILGILATIVVVNVTGKRKEAMIQAARTSIQGISSGIELYEVDTGKFPAALSALLEDDGSPNWHGPYIKLPPVDPWGQPFNYALHDRTYKIISPGPDLTLGTEDDISN